MIFSLFPSLPTWNHMRTTLTAHAQYIPRPAQSCKGVGGGMVTKGSEKNETMMGT